MQEEAQIYSQELIFLLLPPWLSSCMGGSGGDSFTAKLLLPTVTSFNSHVLVQGDGHSPGRVITESQGSYTAPMLLQDGLIPSHWSPKASVP